ncbi:MAG: hypothetical protein QXQ46_09495 [Thermoplasmatales archaeon]
MQVEKEIDGLKTIIGDLTVANETLKKNSTVEERSETKTDLIGKGYIIKDICTLSDYSKSHFYYEAKDRHISLDSATSERITEIII